MAMVQISDEEMQGYTESGTLFKERGVEYKFIDLNEKGMSKGDSNRCSSVPLESLIRRGSKELSVSISSTWNSIQRKRFSIIRARYKDSSSQTRQQSSLRLDQDAWKKIGELCIDHPVRMPHRERMDACKNTEACPRQPFFLEKYFRIHILHQ